MEPLPEVRAVSSRLSALTGVDLMTGLTILSDAAEAIVPSVVGVSLTVVLDDEPFTVTATSEAVSALDASQYLAGGPCLDATWQQASLVVDDVLDEQRWQLYAGAASASGVRASLSLPLGGAGGRTPGAINLYASDPQAFAGREPVLAEAFQTPVEEFVRNADLSFATREAARRLPGQVEEKAKLEDAVDRLSGLLGWEPDLARQRLRNAATQARTPVGKVAELIVAVSTA